MHLVGVLYRSTWQGIKGVRWVAILSGSSRAFYSPPSFLPLRSLSPLVAGYTSRHGNNMAHYYRIGSDSVDSTPRGKRIRSRESRNCESCRFRFTSIVLYCLSVTKILFICCRYERSWRVDFISWKRNRILRNKFFFVEVIQRYSYKCYFAISE